MSDFHLEPKRSDAIEKAAQSAVPVTGTEPASFIKQLKGFWVTFSTMFKKPNTIEYPEVKPEVQPRFHGRHQLNRYEDGLEKCIGCELCAWACPADAIYVEVKTTPKKIECHLASAMPRFIRLIISVVFSVVSVSKPVQPAL